LLPLISSFKVPAFACFTVLLNPHKGLSNFWTGDAAYEAAITNYEFLAHEVVTTKQIIKRVEEAK